MLSLMAQFDRRPRLLVRALIPLLLTAGIFATADAAAAPPATPVFVQEVELESLSETVEAMGTLRATESVTISATVTETISAIHFSDGQRVQAGDVLVELTSREEQAQLQQARSELEEAERQYRRVESLIASNLSTQSVLDERRRVYEIAQAQVKEIEARLSERRIVAPFSGRVGLRHVSVGALVRPGDTITTLDDDSVMKLDMAVPSIYLDFLQPGLKIEAKARALDGETFHGEIVSIGSRVDPVTRSVVVRALIPNNDRSLRPGILMTVALKKPLRQALLIPEEAIVQRGSQAWVYVVDNSGGRVEQRPVTLGVRQPGRVEIRDGVAPGEQVVIHGTLKVRSGSAVEVAAVATGDETLQELLRQARKPDATTPTTDS